MILVDGDVLTVCMLREYLVDDDINLLHVKRSLSMMCSGPHQYSSYRYVIYSFFARLLNI
jgi:hypothetical protein